MDTSLRHLSLLYSLLHCLVVLLLVPIALGSHAIALYEAGKTDEGWLECAWRLAERFMQADTTTLEKFIGVFSGTYYAIDLIILWLPVHKLSANQKYWFTAHHIFCFLGLTGPSVWYARAWDTALAFSGFFIGEVSNPPRCCADIIEYYIEQQTQGGKLQGPGVSVQLMGRRYPLPAMRRMLRSMVHTQLVLFIALRFIGTKMFFALLVPYAQLRITLCMGGLTLVLSIVAAIVMLQDATTSTSAPKEAAVLSHSPSPDVGMMPVAAPAASTAPEKSSTSKRKSRKAE